jgi:hypothetical protein
MVGWAGGSAGPDFFIYTGVEPATHWGHDHTILGEVTDEQSRSVVRELQKLPAHKGGDGMLMLDTPLPLMLGMLTEHA